MAGVMRPHPGTAAATTYDMVVVGGGIYGATIALEAGRRGLRPLLLERDDFGQHTSWNSLRVVHGGLRYLQSLDLPRFFESVAERRWYLRRFPDLVRPLSCVMPLYGRGLRRPAVLRAALAANDLLSWRRDRGVREDRHLPAGRVLGPAETVARFPGVRRPGLRGAACWHDAVMPDSQRLLMEILRWAVQEGAVVLNYTEVEGLLRAGPAAGGVTAVDKTSGERLQFRGKTVVNAAGPWARQLAGGMHRDLPTLFQPSLAFNLLLARKPETEAALAVEPAGGGRTYFLHPWEGHLFAGTYHAPVHGEIDDRGPREEQVAAMLADLNAASPDLRVGLGEVLRVHWGFLPCTGRGSDRLTRRPVFVDHGARGGPAGLFSVVGVKFTTARRVAEQVVRSVARRCGLPLSPPRETPPAPLRLPDRETLSSLLQSDTGQVLELAQRLLQEEAVLRWDDLLLRRTAWGTDPASAERIGAALRDLLGPRLAETNALPG